MRHWRIRARVPNDTSCGSLAKDQTSMSSSFLLMNLVMVFAVEPALREADTQVAKNEV